MRTVSGVMGALNYVESAARDRIARCRRQAAQCREMAVTEPVGRLRTQLLYLAKQYEGMAGELKAERDARTVLRRKTGNGAKPRDRAPR